MKRYAVYGKVVGTKFIGEFDAKSPEDAKKKAIKSGDAYVSLCWSCAEECEDPQIDEFIVEEVDE